MSGGGGGASDSSGGGGGLLADKGRDGLRRVQNFLRRRRRRRRPINCARQRRQRRHRGGGGNSRFAHQARSAGPYTMHSDYAVRARGMGTESRLGARRARLSQPPIATAAVRGRDTPGGALEVRLQLLG
jgi:hypothetical protein